MNRRLVAALVVATACGASSATAGAWDVTVGFADNYRAGSWTPLIISPHAADTAAAGDTVHLGDTVHVWAEDPDGQFVRSPPAVLAADAAGRLVARACVRIGRPTGRLRIEHTPAAGTATISTARLPDALPSTQEVILVVGDLPAARRAVRLLPRGDGPPPTILEPFTAAGAGVIAAGPQARDYDGLDTIILCGTAVADLAADVVAGIDAWVHAGGRLVLAAGTSAEALGQGGGPAAGWLPGPIERLVPLRRLTALETFARSSLLASQPGAATLRVPLLANRGRVPGTVEVFEGATATDLPLVVRRTVGLGTITWVACDLDGAPFRTWPATDTLLVRLLGGRGPERANDHDVEGFVETTDLTAQLRRALEALPREPGGRPTAPAPFAIIIGLGLLYVLCLYPLDWWLASWSQRKGLGNGPAWLSLPLLVAGFTGLAWLVSARHLPAVGTAAQAVELVDLDAASGLVRGRSWIAIPQRDNTSIAVAVAPGPDGGMPDERSAAAAGTAAAVSWFADTGRGFGGIDAAVPHPTLAATDYRYEGSLAALAAVPVAAASDRLFEAAWIARRSPERIVTATLARDAQAALDGEVAHHLPFALDDCHLAHGGWVYDLGTLAPDATVRLRASRGPRSLAGLLTRRAAVGERDLAVRWNPGETDIVRILEVAGFHAAAGGTGYTRIEAGPLSRLDLSPLLAERAILFGRGPAGPGSPWRIVAGEHPVPVATDARLYRIVIPLTASPAGRAESQP